MFAYSLEHICSYSARLQNPPEVIGPGPEGIRVNFYVTSGELTGPKIRGILRPVGGDWFTIRTDGIGFLDVRATIETHDHALIFVAYTGVGDLGEDGYHKFLQGALARGAAFPDHASHVPVAQSLAVFQYWRGGSGTL
jgi:Protein of unknown function (DUF3237)